MENTQPQPLKTIIINLNKSIIDNLHIHTNGPIDETQIKTIKKAVEEACDTSLNKLTN